MKPMLRFVSILLLAVMSFGMLASCNNEEPPTPSDDSASYNSGYEEGYAAGKQEGYDMGFIEGSKNNDKEDDGTNDTIFDENNIVLSFGSLSDIHISGSNDQSETYFRNAIAQLKSLAAIHDKDGLDAIGIAGDIADKGSEAQVNKFASIIKGSDLKNVMLATGNHDYYGNDFATLPNYKIALGDKYFENATDLSMIDKGAYHCVVNGYHFIFLEPLNYKTYCPYDAEVLEWLDNTLKTITDNDPYSYVFVYTHPMIYGTTYGSTEISSYEPSNQMWATVHLTTTLSKYPQVVTFSGHLHFPINDERSIMQTAFTSLGCGSVRYLAIEKGFSNVSGTTPDDCKDISSGLLVQVDANGNLRITRMYFSKNTTFKEPWELSHPTEDGSHLKKYSYTRAHDNEAPVLEGTLKVELNGSAATAGAVPNVTLTFPAATDDDLIHHYVVTITNKMSSVKQSYKFLSDYYTCKNPSDMKKTLSYVLSLGNVSDRGYNIDVVAVDSWGRKSEKISCEFSMDDVSDSMSAELPDVYTDFEFKNGKVTDTKDKFDITVSGATVADTSLTFAGKTNTVGALNINKSGQHAEVTFKDYNASNITNFYNSSTGYTIEALYINRAQAGTQGIVCGTQQGGLGIASKDGVPYFFTYTNDGSINITAKANSSTSELTHIVATVLYNSNTNTTYTELYINGELVAAGSKSGKVKPIGTEAIATTLCFGSDVSKDGSNDEFPMTNCSIADVKMYDSALNFKQVETAYSNAVKAFAK